MQSDLNRENKKLNVGAQFEKFSTVFISFLVSKLSRAAANEWRHYRAVLVTYVTQLAPYFPASVAGWDANRRFLSQSKAFDTQVGIICLGSNDLR